MMNDPTLELACKELAATLVGRRVGRIFQLSRLSLAIDFRDGSRFLFISAEPSAPRVYLIDRRLRDIEKKSMQQLPFAQILKKRISGATVTAIEKIQGERVVFFRLTGETELGDPTVFSLVVQLTGRSANLFLLDGTGRIIDRLRDTFGDGQEIATIFAPPARAVGARNRDETVFPFAGYDSISEALDLHYIAAEKDAEFKRIASAARANLKQAAAKSEKLAAKLRADLKTHGDPAVWKRSGDLILANLADAVVMDGRVLVVDYFDDSTPVVEIEIDENDELTAAAETFFKRYAKARNARTELTRRLAETETSLLKIREQQGELETWIEEGDIELLKDIAGKPKSTGSGRKRVSGSPTGSRSFVSSDGFEILVGKGAKDNDHLTFRVARSTDLWLHAADYPGSHVVVRNSARNELPQRTVLEAAKLAAFYSQARSHPKAAVHYTQRKNVHKPRGGAPGLVSLTTFKTILVEPELSFVNTEPHTK